MTASNEAPSTTLRTCLDHKLAALPTMSSAELRAAWQELTAAPIPRISPSLLRLALACKYQAHAQGGLPRSVQQTLDQLARGATRTTPTRPGMRLVREWDGKAHVVEIGEEKTIRWEGRDWRSLSEVARAITGTRWSGPAFFGLKQRQQGRAAA